jgi:DNA-binding HxlR family transcriptional regulator
MSNMERIIREEARLIVLRELAMQPDNRLNSALLQRVLETFGISRSRDWLHEELRWLEEIGAVRATDAASVRIAELTAKGADHVLRRIVIEGVKRPSPEI